MYITSKFIVCAACHLSLLPVAVVKQKTKTKPVALFVNTGVLVAVEFV